MPCPGPVRIRVWMAGINEENDSHSNKVWEKIEFFLTGDDKANKRCAFCSENVFFNVCHLTVQGCNSGWAWIVKILCNYFVNLAVFSNVPNDSSSVWCHGDKDTRGFPFLNRKFGKKRIGRKFCKSERSIHKTNTNFSFVVNVTNGRKWIGNASKSRGITVNC